MELLRLLPERQTNIHMATGVAGKMSAHADGDDLSFWNDTKVDVPLWRS